MEKLHLLKLTGAFTVDFKGTTGLFCVVSLTVQVNYSGPSTAGFAVAFEMKNTLHM